MASTSHTPRGTRSIPASGPNLPTAGVSAQNMMSRSSPGGTGRTLPAAPRVGGAGSGGKSAPVPRGLQTKVNTFFPAIDGSSRDSEGAAGSGGGSAGATVASMAERASAAAAAAILGGFGVAPSSALILQHQSSMSRLSPVAETAHREREEQMQQQLDAKDREIQSLREQIR